MTTVTKLAGATLLIALTSCSFVQFERGPYAVRDLVVVYSVQEDVTFLSWRLREDAQPSRVHFELLVDGEWTVLDLSEAPFPAEPYKCGGKYWCFQYQVPGDFELPATSESPLRSVYDDAIFMGPAEQSRRVRETFRVEPIAIGHNDGIVSERFDWFAEHQVPLRRDYQWQFSRWDGMGCVEPSEREWTAMVDPIAVDRQWTDLAVVDSGICFNARPARQDAPGAVYSSQMQPSAETTWEAQEYVPPRVEAPLVWGVMLDLEIPSEARCRAVKDRLLQMLEVAIRARSDQAQRLGVYTPVDSETGADLGGCDQSPTRDYPFEQMLHDAEVVRNEHTPTEVRVAWVFVNNIELPPPVAVVEHLVELGLSSGGTLGVEEIGGVPIPDELRDEVPDIAEDGEPHDTFMWGIGSNVFLRLVPWNQTTGWRPVEDETFLADIKSAAKANFPFATMMHDETTEVEIRRPQEADSQPIRFKICHSTPHPIDAVGITSGRPSYRPHDVIPWPHYADEVPYYKVELDPQILVPSSAYARRPLEVVVEVCTAFCSGPFRTRSGAIARAWDNTSMCQWEP